jgi:molybdate transport system substrate-binding protein
LTRIVPSLARLVATLALSAVAAPPTMAETIVKVYAAGSLRAPLTEAAELFKAQGGGTVAFEFGPSGLLGQRLLRGEPADVFASANMEHPQELTAMGKATRVRMFARNRICALARASLGVTTANVLERMLDPRVKVGTSSPKADPSGDYAWQVFERAEKVTARAYDTLSRKALQLTGGPSSPPPPKDRSPYVALFDEGKVDIFLTYCTTAGAAHLEEPALVAVTLPPALTIGAEYGLVTLNGASAAGNAFANFLLGPEGQRVMAAAGFSAP